MPKKIAQTESSLRATDNLKPHLDDLEQKRASGAPYTILSESPHLKFLEPLHERTPQHVYAQNGEFVIGNVRMSKDTERYSDSNRIGVWNAATGELVFKQEGAVSMAWTPDFTQIGVWIEHYVPDPTLPESFRGNARSEWNWRFERWNWETKSLLSSCELSNGGYLWSVYLEFPKKYKGRISRLYCRCEDGGESIFVLCDDENGDRELSPEEMEVIRKSK